MPTSKKTDKRFKNVSPQVAIQNSGKRSYVRKEVKGKSLTPRGRKPAVAAVEPEKAKRGRPVGTTSAKRSAAIRATPTIKPTSKMALRSINSSLSKVASNISSINKHNRKNNLQGAIESVLAIREIADKLEATYKKEASRQGVSI